MSDTDQLLSTLCLHSQHTHAGPAIGHHLSLDHIPQHREYIPSSLHSPHTADRTRDIQSQTENTCCHCMRRSQTDLRLAAFPQSIARMLTVPHSQLYHSRHTHHSLHQDRHDLLDMSHTHLHYYMLLQAVCMWCPQHKPWHRSMCDH